MKKGFTLIEIIISIALLALFMFGVTILFPRGLGLLKRSAALTAAANLAQAQIETMLALDYQNVATGTFEARQVVQEKLERQTTVTFVDPETLAESATDRGLKKIVVIVFYPSVYGEKTFTLSTLIAHK